MERREILNCSLELCLALLQFITHLSSSISVFYALSSSHIFENTSIYKKYSYDEGWAVSCGCVVLCGGSSAGNVQGALDDRGSFGYKGEGCSCLDFGSGMGASVYLEPAAEAACHNGSTATGCPESPCPIFLPRNCNIMYCRYIQKKPGEFLLVCIYNDFSINFQHIIFFVSILRKSFCSIMVKQKEYIAV